jgi:DNA-binding NtrC family response regulator
MQATVLTAATCDRACRLLSRATIDVVITDVSLADGNWRDLMAHLLSEGLNPCVVVRSAADDPCLWSEVLWRGAYEMLVEPFSVEEAVRILEGALRTREYFQLECPRGARGHGANESRWRTR